MREKMHIILLSILELIIGCLLLINPVGFTRGIIIFIGILLTLIGIWFIVKYFWTDAEEAATHNALIIGILGTIFGLCCVFQSTWFVALFPLLTTIYGIFTLINGVTKVQWAVNMIRLKRRPWGWMAASATLTVLCAGVILLHPFSTTAILWMFIGITIIIEAVVDIIAAIFSNPDSAGSL